jgi:hypothetical protein
MRWKKISSDKLKRNLFKNLEVKITGIKSLLKSRVLALERNKKIRRIKIDLRRLDDELLVEWWLFYYLFKVLDCTIPAYLALSLGVDLGYFNFLGLLINYGAVKCFQLGLELITLWSIRSEVKNLPILCAVLLLRFFYITIVLIHIWACLDENPATVLIRRYSPFRWILIY